MTSADRASRRLQICAHRHGNDLTLLRAAETAGVDLIEVDIHLFHGELDARHEKTIGPLPVVWDRRRLPSWNPPRQRFSEVLASAQPETRFYIDLKGWDRRLSRHVITALEPRRSYVVSARVWWLLHPFEGLEGVLVLRSIGAPWQLWWFRRRRRGRFEGGISISSDLLTPELAAELKTRVQTIFAWRVSSYAHARELEHWGVDGVIVDSLDLACELLDRDR